MTRRLLTASARSAKVDALAIAIDATIEAANLRGIGGQYTHFIKQMSIRSPDLIGYIPPAEAEANYYAALENLDMAA